MVGWASKIQSNSQLLDNEPRYIPDFSEGDDVEHGLFGVGKIVEIDDDTVAVYFKKQELRN